jgi:hypothetical protein
MILTIPKTDKGFSLTIAATDSAGVAKSLASFSAVKLKMWKPTVPGTLIVDSAVTVTNAGAGLCTFSVPSTMTITKGIYLAELECTATDVIESLDTFVVRIKESA